MSSQREGAVGRRWKGKREANAERSRQPRVSGGLSPNPTQSSCEGRAGTSAEAREALDSFLFPLNRLTELWRQHRSSPASPASPASRFGRRGSSSGELRCCIFGWPALLHLISGLFRRDESCLGSLWQSQGETIDDKVDNSQKSLLGQKKHTFLYPQKREIYEPYTGPSVTHLDILKRSDESASRGQKKRTVVDFDKLFWDKEVTLHTLWPIFLLCSRFKQSSKKKVL